MKIRIGDILIVIGIVLVAVMLIVLPRQQTADSLVAVIIADDVEIRRIDLSQTDEAIVFDLGEHGVLITAQDGQIWFTSSTCADQTCVNTGKLGAAGDIAVCLPNRVLVKIEGINHSDIDVIAE